MKLFACMCNSTPVAIRRTRARARELPAQPPVSRWASRIGKVAMCCSSARQSSPEAVTSLVRSPRFRRTVRSVRRSTTIATPAPTTRHRSASGADARAGRHAGSTRSRRAADRARPGIPCGAILSGYHRASSTMCSSRMLHDEGLVDDPNIWCRPSPRARSDAQARRSRASEDRRCRFTFGNIAVSNGSMVVTCRSTARAAPSCGSTTT